MPILPILLLGGVAAVYFLRMQTMGTNLKFLVRSIKLKKGTPILQPEIIITLGVQNVTGAEARIKSITGEVSYQGSVFADISMFREVAIKRNSETMVDVIAIPNIFGITTIIKSVILNKQSGATITIRGVANANGVNMPFSSSFTYN